MTPLEARRRLVLQALAGGSESLAGLIAELDTCDTVTVDCQCCAKEN